MASSIIRFVGQWGPLDRKCELLATGPKGRGLDDVAYHLQLIYVPRCVYQDELFGHDSRREPCRQGAWEAGQEVGNGSRSRGAGHRMSLAPALFQNILGVVRMQVHVETVVAVVHMTDFSPASGVDGIGGEEGEPFLFKTGYVCLQLVVVAMGEVVEADAEKAIHCSRTVLADLPLRSDAGYFGTRTPTHRNLWMHALDVADGWICTFGDRWWAIGIGKSEDAKIGDFGISK